MPANENERRNQQKPVLENPSPPDHDRRNDPGMRKVRIDPNLTSPIDLNELHGADDDATAPPDQEFSQILESGARANEGRIPDDPNNWLTADPDPSPEQDPENRGDSLPDLEDPDRRG